MEQKFYKCAICGQIVSIIKESGAQLVCCNQPMNQLIAGTTEASTEKHIPIFETNNGVVSVSVGEVEHPMSPEHYIEWISLETNKGTQMQYLNPTDKPFASFNIDKDEIIKNVYAHCNLHSLWKK